MYISEQRITVILAVMVSILLFGVNTASAHFNFFLPDEWSMDGARENSVEIIWGHPYEGIYFDPPTMINSTVLKPDGTKENLPSGEITVTGAEGQVKGREISFTPGIKGDYIVYADFEALVVEEEEVAWEDHVKAVIHHKASRGWDQRTGQIMEILPLTRPYGLEEGFVFTGQALYNGQPLGEAPVEIEKYYAVGVCTDENLPDEPMVTRETRSDPNGIFSFTLDEPGVWVVCASNTVGTIEGHDRDIRGILMINMEEESSLLSTEADSAAGDGENGSENTGNTMAIALSVIAIMVAVAAIVIAGKKKT